ncbi:MAG: HutD family protein [Oscillospiraceae bacterium]
MRISLLTAADYVVSQWSGGVTTQIAIAPEGAVYADRDFLWRLSSATVDLEESVFTALPDYHRLVSLLHGTLVISHDEGAPTTLAPYDIYAFDGGIGTQGRGRCVDFNLMLRKGACQGTLRAICVPDAREMPVPADPESTDPVTRILYCAEGSGTLSADGQAVALLPGQAARIDEFAGEALLLSCSGPAAFLLAQIQG